MITFRLAITKSRVSADRQILFTCFKGDEIQFQELSRLCSLLEDHLEELQTSLKYRCQDLLGSKQWIDLNNSYETLTLACEMVTVSTKVSWGLMS